MSDSDLGKIYDEDGYCVACGNGKWKAHMPQCEIADLIDRVNELEKALKLFAQPNRTDVAWAIGLEGACENAAQVLNKGKND